MKLPYNNQVHIFGKIAILFTTLIIYPLIGTFIDTHFIFMMLGIGLLFSSGAFLLLKYSSPYKKFDKWFIKITFYLGLFLLISSIITIKDKKESINTEFSVTNVDSLKIVCSETTTITNGISDITRNCDTIKSVYSIINISNSKIFENSISSGVRNTKWHTDYPIEKLI